MGKAILINASYSESLVIFRKELILAMVAGGHTVHVSAPSISPRQAFQINAMGAISHEVPLSRAGLNLFADIQYFWRLCRLIKYVQPDIVMGYTIKPNIWGSIASRFCGVPSASLITGLGYAFIQRRGIVRRLVQIFARRLYRIATDSNQVVIFQNKDDRDDFCAAGCLSDISKSRIVDGSGVDLDYFTKAPLPKDPVFLLIARLLWSKGIQEYVDAASSVREQCREARFTLAGYFDGGPDGVSRGALKKWIEAGIEYLGPLDDVRPAIASSSIYVLPSYREGTPRTVLEAMAMGRPIITTDAPGCRETTTENINGLLVPVQNSVELAKAMIKLSKSAELRAAMGNESRKIAVLRYDARNVAAAMIKYLDL